MYSTRIVIIVVPFILSEPMPYLAAKRRHINSCYTLEVMSITTTEVGYGLVILIFPDIFYFQCVCDTHLCNRAGMAQVRIIYFAFRFNI